MDQQQTDQSTGFVIRILERINESVDLYQPISDILGEIRAEFAFGCAFIYEADHKGTFFLHEHSEAYAQTHLKKEIELAQVMGEPSMEELARRKSVIVHTAGEDGPLERQLTALFDARSLIVIPIKSQTREVMALVGLVDRRGAERHQEINIDLAYSVLAAVANHVKLRMFQVRVESTQKSLESVLDHMGVDIYVNDFLTHEVLYANRSMAAPYGGVGNMVGKTCWRVLYDDKTEPCEYCPQKKLIDENGEPTKVYSWDYQRPFDGSWFRVLSATFRWVDGRLAHVVSSVDITENKQNEELIRQLAEYDALTGLPNRRKLLQDCGDQLAAIGGREGYALFFDLDGFKKINDEIGHRAGDDLLAAIGAYLEETALFRGRSYRYGGDEFVVLALDYTLEQVTEAARVLIERFTAPWKTADGEIHCRNSVGIARYPQDATTGSDLLHKADMAMYAAKMAGKGQARFYSEEGDFLTLEAFAAAHRRQRHPEPTRSLPPLGEETDALPTA